MDAASSKSRTRKSMRVATIFTGVAACTGGMTQAAHAQAIRPETTARPATAVYGSIRWVLNCAQDNKDSHFMHYSTVISSPYQFRGSICFGFKGSDYSPPGIGVRYECGGNNHGFVEGTNGGRFESYNFGPGNGYHALFWSHLDGVDINSWTGADKCGVAPGV
jgi:hypothetical protein